MFEAIHSVLKWTRASLDIAAVEIYLLMTLTCYMLIEILIPLKELSMPN